MGCIPTLLLVLLWYFDDRACLMAASKHCYNTTNKCDSMINVRWWEIKPYINMENITHVEGFFPEIIKDLVLTCCGNCTKIGYKNKVKSESGLMGNFGNVSFINFPVYGTMMENSKVRKPYIPLIESPGIVYLVNNDQVVESTYHVVIKAVTKAWPILIFIYLSAALSGIVVWALDCYRNWEHFPVSFLKGSWEGFWWSIVSMTTVGYGDRCPKSNAARVFSIVWVMIGLVMIALFNGSLTSELTAFSMTSSPILQGEKVAVIAGTREETYAQTVMVNRKAVADIKAMKLYLTKKSYNLMLDTYVAAVHRNFLNESKILMLRDVLEHNFAYGMMLSGSYENSLMKKCLERQLSIKQSKVTTMVLQNMKKGGFSTIDFSSTPIEQLKKDHLLSPFGPVQRNFYIVCSILVFLVLVGGTIWQIRKTMHEKNEPKTEIDVSGIEECSSIDELMDKQNKELASAMRKEVERFYASWISQKDKLFKTCVDAYSHKKKKKRKDPVMVETVDVPKYDFSPGEDTFELTTCDDPKYVEDDGLVKSLGCYEDH